MTIDMKGYLPVIGLVTCCGLVGALLGTAIADAMNDKKVIQTVQCIDTASQETVYYLDHIERVEGQYDTWSFVIKDGVVSYVQPSGVVCTISNSVNAIENGTEVID